jgi:hypothetical protein
MDRLLAVLSELELKPAQGSASVAPGGRPPSLECFGTAALAKLLQILQRFDDLSAALPMIPARWHPAGYMVFTLAHGTDLGTLRLHIWPQGHRLVEPREGSHRDIHDHVLHITSVVLAGTYVDDLFDVTLSADLVQEPLRVFTPPRGISGSTTLVATGQWAAVTPTGHRNVPQFSHHLIAAGEFHAPRIPVEELCATLSFSSPAVTTAGPHILIESNADEVTGWKRAVKESAKISALNAMLDTISTAPVK